MGKTLLAGGFPHSVVIACPIAEATSLAQLSNASSISILGANTWEDFVSAVEMAINKRVEPGVYETITVDNLTPAYALCLEYTVNQQSRKVIGEHTWTQLNRNFMAVIDNLLITKHNKNVVLVSHNRVEKDESGNVVRIIPDFGGSLSRKIVGRMNALFYYRLQGKNRELVTSAVPGIDVGSRWSLPRSLTNPTSCDIIELINQYKAKIKEQNS